MDQLRKAWSWLQRHHFWVLTLLAIAVALGCWWHGATKLFAEFTTNKGKIESEFNAARNAQSQQFHANPSVQEAQQAEIANQQKSVTELWKQLYERQTAEVLKWPSNLSEEFRKYVEKLKFGDEIPPNLRRNYNNYIQGHFKELPKIIGAVEAPEDGQGGYGSSGSFDPRSFMDSQRGGVGRGYGQEGPGQAVEEPEFIVVWLDQEVVRNELYPRATPSAKRIWKIQEDLWVYEALLRIIANTNKAAGADRFTNAAVRVIESLEVGKTAALASRGRGRIDIVAGPATGGEMMEGGDPRMMEGGMPPEGGAMETYGRGGEMGEMYGEGGRGGMGMEAAANDAELFNNRYVGADGAAIPDPGDGNAAAFGTEFKRLPVRMRLWMDQRWLPQLISECANAPLQVEIQEVRINPSDSGSYGERGGGYSGRGGDYGMMGGQTAEEMTPDAEPNMKTVVLQGTVYIFNPPTEAAADASLANAEVQ
jgi:hypothetical protein